MIFGRPAVRHHVPMPAQRTRSLAAGLLVAAGSVAVITGVIFGLREVAPVLSTGVVYMLAVLLVSSYWGLWMGLATAVLSALAFNFFHIPPTGRFTIAESENWLGLGGVPGGRRGHEHARRRGARTRDEAERRTREADLSAELARVLLGGAGVEDSLGTAGQRIANAFDLPSVSIELGVGGQRPAPARAAADRGREPHRDDAGPGQHGSAIVLDALQDRVLPGLETLVAAVRRREELESQVIETKALRRCNVVQDHAPALRLSRSALAADRDHGGGRRAQRRRRSRREERDELTSVITAESARLSRLVDNLLDLSAPPGGRRRAAPGLDAAWTRCSSAVIASVAAPPAGFDVRLDPELPPVNADAAQLERALANVLENAARFAGDEPVAVRGRARTDNQILVRISDHGPGIARPRPRARLRALPSDLGRGRARARGSGSPSRAASSRRTAGGSEPSRCPARARASSSRSRLE